MATVDKNFRIKNGLVVEGTTATVNGNDILTKNTQDGDSYIIGVIGGTATSENTANAVVKRDGNGNFAAGTVTVNRVNLGEQGYIDLDNDIIIANTDGYDVVLEGEDIRLNATDDVLLNAGQGGDVVLTSNTGTIRLEGPSIYAGENLQYVDAEKVATRGYVDTAEQDAKDYADTVSNTALTDAQNYTNTEITAALGTAQGYADTAEADAKTYADGLAVNYDAAGSAASAQTAAQSYADGLAVNYDAAGSAATAEQNANDYADDLINDASTSSSEVWSAYKTSTEIGLAQAAAEQHADDAVAALVGSAPAVLDTIQELATALENNPDIIADLENVAAGKQNTLTAGSNIDITGDTISVTGLDSADISDFNTAALSATSAAYDAAGAAAAAQTAAEGFATTAANDAQDAAEAYADGLASNYDAVGSAALAQSAAEATALGYVSDVLDGTSSFTAVNVNDQAKQVAASSTSLGSVPVTAYEWSKAAYRSAKFLVKIDNGTHNEISEILLTLDSSDNIAITEYAVVGTNGARGTITADVSGSNVRVRVTPVNDSTIKISGTLLA